MANTVHLTSRIGSQHRAALENLLFFNSRQHRVLDGIKYSIERYGAPELVEREGSLRVEVPTLPEVQSLFAVREQDGKPVGVAVFAREAPDRFVVLHVVVMSEQDGAGTAPATRSKKCREAGARRGKGRAALRQGPIAPDRAPVTGDCMMTACA